MTGSTYPHIQIYPEHNRSKMVQRWLTELDYLVDDRDRAIRVWRTRIPDTPDYCEGYVVRMTSGVWWAIYWPYREKGRRMYIPFATRDQAEARVRRWAHRAWRYHARGRDHVFAKRRASVAAQRERHHATTLRRLRQLRQPRWPWEEGLDPDT